MYISNKIFSPLVIIFVLLIGSITFVPITAHNKFVTKYMSKEKIVNISALILFAIFVYWIKNYKNQKTNKNEDATNQYEEEDEIFYDIDIMNNLSTLLKRENKISKLQKYKSDFLPGNDISEEDNRSFENYGLKPNISNIYSYYVKNVRFFYGKCDNDEEPELGWACVWRCIQTSLSFYNIFYTLSSLSFEYRDDKNNSKEFCKLNPTGHFIFNDSGIKSKFYVYYHNKNDPDLVNYLNTKTPKSKIINSFFDFNNDNNRESLIVGFSILKDILKGYFEEYQTPLIICVGKAGYNILGIKEMNNNNIVLWIADPHKTSKKAGLYYLELNEQGDKITCTGIDDNCNGLCTAQLIKLTSKPVFFFPRSKIDPILSN